jgi:hypothetical protein
VVRSVYLIRSSAARLPSYANRGLGPQHAIIAEAVAAQAPEDRVRRRRSRQAGRHQPVYRTKGQSSRSAIRTVTCRCCSIPRGATARASWVSCITPMPNGNPSQTIGNHGTGARANISVLSLRLTNRGEQDLGPSRRTSGFRGEVLLRLGKLRLQIVAVRIKRVRLITRYPNGGAIRYSITARQVRRAPEFVLRMEEIMRPTQGFSETPL